MCCQRYEAAIERCKTLLEDSLDRKYIVAETRWRMADIDGALAEISSRRAGIPTANWREMRRPGREIIAPEGLDGARRAQMEDEQFATAIRCFDKVLETPEGKMMTRLRGKILSDGVVSIEASRVRFERRSDRERKPRERASRSQRMSQNRW